MADKVEAPAKADKNIKNSIRINGTTFNRLAVSAMTKEDFVAEYLKHEHVFPGLDTDKKSKQLAEAYMLIKK